jgi:hypothetical protein
MLILFVNRAKQIPAAVATGTVLLLMGINLVVLLGLATFGVLVTHDPHAVALRPYVFAGLAGFAVYLGVVALRPPWLARFAVLGAAFRAGLGGHLLAVLVRLPHIAAVFLAHYVAMRAFGIRPPLWSFLTLMPVVSLVTALPISVQGLGTTQLAAVYFFAPYAQGSQETREATVLAYSLTTSVLAILFMLSMGLAFLRRGLRLLAGDRPEADVSSPPTARP